ncbi:E3 ubiquitin-protein ligase TRIM21-like [Hyalella azteca]|uniref:E3 ubiquitin-protein ligase TRIM21-like n=1 Tax=Hyalella azteca TaxID=294128 RepID=A0A8B7NBN9_HYAAZ|nr:E3 ubiquitin-protein ligase TRIM21-like [Hyalella azteca]
MATAMLECDICTEEFDSGNHKPLCLTCGHTFCFSCILELTTSSDICICPKCKKETAQDIDKILVNYVLIPTENKPYQRLARSPSETRCLQHHKTLDYLCVDCIKLTCFKCTRDTHVTHKVEAIDDLVSGDESAMNSTRKIQTTMQNKIFGLKNLATALNDFSGWIDDAINVKNDLDEWKEALQVQIISADKDFQAWKDLVSNVDEEERLECMEILRRLKLEPEVYSKLPEITEKLGAVVENYRSLKMPSNPHNLLPHGQHWTVTNSDEGGRAVRSLLNNRKPSRLVVISLHTDPIPSLSELLALIVSNDTGDLSLVNLDTFWWPPKSDFYCSVDFIKEFGRWLSAVYGTPYDLVSYMRERQREPRMFTR